MIINEKIKRYTRLGYFSLKALLRRVLMSKSLFSHALLVGYGFRGNLLAWLTDYPTDRTQQVKLKSSISIVGRNEAGVPQGSVLGPLLFLIFINDLPDGLRGLTRLFANDTSNSHVSRDLEEIQRTNNDDLKLINDWGEKWLVDFNPQKNQMCNIWSN